MPNDYKHYDKTGNTKKPSGLGIARDNMKFTFTWKIADSDYDEGIKVGWRINTGKWSAYAFITVGNKATQASVTLSASNYWPTTNTYLYSIELAVKGKRKTATVRDSEKMTETTTTYNWSDWSKYAFDLMAPSNPSISQELDERRDNTTTFTWNTSTSKTDRKPFVDCEWETRVIYNNQETDGSKLNWKPTSYLYEHGTSGASGTRTITEDTEISNTKASWTRWFRVRSRGCGGNGDIKGCSYWRYSKHVYARPYTPSVNEVVEGARNFYTMTWTAPANAALPVDIVSIEYTAGTPLTNLRPPSDPNWEVAQELGDTSGRDSTTFLADRNLDFDECLWVRVSAWHDRLSSPSNAVLAKAGRLTPPSGLTVVLGGTEDDPMATVSATNESDVPDAVLAVVYKSGDVQEVLGIIPRTGSPEVTIHYPKQSGTPHAEFFGVYAFQGTYEITTTSSTGVTIYAINPNMTSSMLWDGGYIPLEPTNVRATKSEVPGEAILTWTWRVAARANRAEISWSQNPNAWESTEEPDTYVLTNVNKSKWRVSGLSVGTTWYFRVRLANETADGITWGPYSDAVSLDMSEIPSAPVVSLSTAVVNPDKSFTVSWSYVSNDGTQQDYAEIREATFVDGEIVINPGRLAKVTSGTSKSISTKNRAGWESGTDHFIVVRVNSKSGQMSEYSSPVPISVAPPVTCYIEQTSLEEEVGRNLEVYPYYHTSKVQNGITFTDNGDGSVTVDGTATADTTFWLAGRTIETDAIKIDTSEGYVLTGCPAGGSVGTYALRARVYVQGVVPDPSTGSTVNDIGSGASIATGNAYVSPFIGVWNGTTVSNLTFYPMLRLASDPDTDWETYSITRTLTQMPLTATVLGGARGETTLVVERAAEYHMIRPDGDSLDGYEGETVAMIRQNGEGQITVDFDELIGVFDDGAPYRLIATTADNLGQSASRTIDFDVHWTHQAEIPTATARMEGTAAVITVTAPEHALSGDVCDIYRLTADLPELVVQGGAFGVEYVDPYPAIGEGYGHRCVHRTVNGDYITADNQPAWVDIGSSDGDLLDIDYGVIDFDGNSLPFRYNAEANSSWSKDFTETRYLGGSIVGDWNPGVSRTTTINAVLVQDEEFDFEMLRRLAEYPGICHVRTQDGSSYAADVQVSDGLGYSTAGRLNSFTLNITRVDSEKLDGIPYSEWEVEE